MVCKLPSARCWSKASRERGFERKHGECRHQRIAQGHLHLVNTVIRDGGKAPVKQVEERIGTKMLASFRCRGGHSNPRHDIIQVCNRSTERCIVAFMFTKS